MRRTLLIALLAALGCEPSPLTEVVVTVHADSEVAGRATFTSLVLTRDPTGAATVVHDNRGAKRKAEFPYSIGLSPSEGREDGTYQLEVSAWQGDQPLATARLLSGYVSGQTRYIDVWLEGVCIDVLCGPQTTCSAGSCVDAKVEAKDFSRNRETAPRSSDLSKPVSVDVPSAKPGDGMDDLPERPDAGDAPSPRPVPDAGVPTSPGPVDSPDATQPTEPSTIPPDAGTLMPPVTNPPVVPDAGTPTVPDAGTVVPSDAGVTPPSFVCAPMGTWIARRDQLKGGTCGSQLDDFPVEFYGKLSDPMANEGGCMLMPTLSADGCVMTYQHDCRVTDNDGKVFIEREIGRTEMTSATTMVGTATVVLLDPITYADLGCKSLVTLSARKQ